MSKIRRVDFSPDEWLSGTMDLTAEEKGVYWTVCSLMYSRGGPIPDDEQWIAKTAGCHWRTWRRIRDRLITLGKLRLTPEGLINDRVERELARAQGRLKKSSEAAQESVRRRAERAQDARINASGGPQEEPISANYNDLGQATASAPDELSTNEQPSTSNHQPTKTPRAAASPLMPRATEDAAFAGWQALSQTQGWPDAQFLTSTRRFKLQAVLGVCGGLEGWKAALVKAATTANFLKNTDGQWQRWFNFDWMINVDNFTKLMEGRYAEHHRDDGNERSLTAGLAGLREAGTR